MVSPRSVIALPSRSLGSTLMSIAIRGAKAAVTIKKSEVAAATSPTLFFLKRRQASWRGLLLVSTSAGVATAGKVEDIWVTVDLLYGEGNSFLRNSCESHPKRKAFELKWRQEESIFPCDSAVQRAAP